MRLLLFVALIFLASGLKADLAEDADKYLLPWNFRPEHYELTLYTHIEQFKEDDEDSFAFMGIVEISVLVLYGDQSEVVLHSYDDIVIVDAEITGLDIEVPDKLNVTVGNYDSETNKQTLLVNPPLNNNGRYRITLYYIGKNNNKLRGFYRSSYQDNDNQTRWLLTTHFESFGARQAFPSFDEPELKATFRLTVHYNQTLANQGYSAFFNTEIESEEIRNGVHVTTFKKTPRPLSTYLVAFIVAPFDVSPELAYFNSSFNGENGVKPFRTIGQPKFFSPKRQDFLSQVAGPAALNTMTRLTGVGFGMEKVEQAGIPDFAAGAMENWGLVTYRETALFYDNETDPTSRKQSVVSTSTHELAHQWFGDLVTLHWWTDVWLNEGFATFFATHASNEFREPDLNTSDWNLIGQFVTGTLQGSALKTDAKPTSRPLTSEAYLPATIDAFFDGISYDKGGSVLRMWLHTLGSEVFYSGLNRYLRLQEENVGTPEILLASFDGAIETVPANQRPQLPDTVANLFENWHSQAGYPVLNVTRQGATLTISQKRFLDAPGDDSPRWNVPLSYSTEIEQNFENTSAVAFLLESDSSTQLTLKNGSAKWVVINNQQTGYYRVNYDQDNWEQLLAVLSGPDADNLIHEFNRAQIIDDANSLGASTHENYLNYDLVLRLLGTLKAEKSLIVWRSGLRAMKDLLARLGEDANTSSLLKEYFVSLIKPIFEELSLYVQENEAHTTKLLRAEIAQIACLLGVPTCVQQAKQLFEMKKAHPDVRRVVLCEGIKTSDISTWERVLTEALSEENSVKRDMLYALACSVEEAQIARLWEIMSDEKIVNEDELISTLLSLAEHNPRKSWVDEVAQVIRTRRWLSSESEIIKTLEEISARSAIFLKNRNVNISNAVQKIVNQNQRWFVQKQPQIAQWLSVSQWRQ